MNRPDQEIRTHAAMNRRFSGTPVALADGEARLELELVEEMRADAHGLVHGGFLFSLADHAAMLAVNHPNVVLGSAEVKFLSPAVVGDTVVATARLDRVEGKKQIVAVDVRRGGTVVFEGEFVCFSPPRHVLARDA